MHTRSTYSLNSKQIDDALAILDSEREAVQSLARVLRKIVPQEIVLIDISAVSLIAGLILFFRGWVLATVLVFGVLAVAVLLYLLPFRQEVRAIRRLRDVQSSLDIKRFSWFYELQQPRTLLSDLFYLLAVGLTLISLGRSWLLDISAACSILAYVVIYSESRPRTLQPLKELLETNERLRTRLLSLQRTLAESDGAMTISIPEAEYKQIARIEQALISLDRKRTIEQRRKEPNKSVYAVQQSRTVLKKKSALEPSIRLRIQTQIDELSTDPQLLDAREEADGTWRLPVSETSWEISYTLIGDSQHIMVHDLLERAKSKRQNQEREGSA